MKTISDFTPFQEAQSLLSALTAEHEALTLERQEILQKLSMHSGTIQAESESLGAIETARRVLNGDVPKNGGEAIRALQEREMTLRERLDALSRSIKTMPAQVELLRERGQAERRRELAKEFEETRKAFLKAADAMAAACRQESALIAEMTKGGFGAAEPIVTTALWLNRESLLNNS